MSFLFGSRVPWPILLAFFAGCSERRPTPHGPEPVQSSTTPAAPVPVPVAASSPSPSPSPSSAPPSAPDGGPPSAAALPASLLDADGKPLPQTDERPRIDGAAFKRRMELVAEAIVNDEPERARPAFFPVIAYEQVKAVAKPARDWEYRLVRAFERNIHEYHHALGVDAARAKFVGISVDEAAARFMKPGSEGNRLGYYRVLRSRLTFERADGKRQDFELTSLISWRGEWYVVHLHGF